MQGGAYKERKKEKKTMQSGYKEGYQRKFEVGGSSYVLVLKRPRKEDQWR